MKPFYKSKKFWMSILTMFVPMISKSLGIELDTQELMASIAGPVSYVLGQAYVDGKKE